MKSFLQKLHYYFIVNIYPLTLKVYKVVFFNTISIEFKNRSFYHVNEVKFKFNIIIMRNNRILTKKPFPRSLGFF